MGTQTRRLRVLLSMCADTVFAFIGCMVFGNLTDSYADLGQGVLTTAQMLMGNYTPQDDMGQNYWTTIFYWFYLVLVQTIMLNALLAIIIGAYDNTKATVDQDTKGTEDLISVIWRDMNKNYRAGMLQVKLPTLMAVIDLAKGAEHGDCYCHLDPAIRAELEAIAARLGDDGVESNTDLLIMIPGEEPDRDTQFLVPAMVHDQEMVRLSRAGRCDRGVSEYAYWNRR